MEAKKVYKKKGEADPEESKHDSTFPSKKDNEGR